MDILENSVTVEKDSGGNIVVIRPEAKFILVNQDEKYIIAMKSKDGNY